jgi:HlyD family secretion protein
MTAGMTAAPALRTALRPAALAGGFGALALLAVLIAWAALTPIAGAVIAPGQTVVRGQPRVVQSLEGGVVAAVAVAAGDRVAAGQILLRLDPGRADARLAIAEARLAEALARRDRLAAEAAGRAGPEYRDPPLPLPGLSLARAGQDRIFAARAAVLAGLAEQARADRRQLQGQIAGLDGRIAGKRDELGLLEADLGDARTLQAGGLLRQSELRALQRGRAALQGEIAALAAERDRLAAALGDRALATRQRRREFHESVVTDLRQVTAEIAALLPEIAATRAERDRALIRAPVAGIVHEMAVTTPGEVVAPGAAILQVVPLQAGVEIALRLDPRAIDRVWTGQAAAVLLTGLDARITPRLRAEVASISPGTIRDPLTGQEFYRLRLDLPEAERARLGPVALLPGMPVEAFLQTGARSVLDYLLAPLGHQLARAFRER